AVAINAYCKRLSDRTCAVLERDVLGGEIIGINENRWGSKRTDRFLVETDVVRVEIVGNHSAERVFSDEHHESLFALHIDDLAIRAGLDEDYPSTVRGGGLRDSIDGVLHCSVVGGTVGRDDGVRAECTLCRQKDEQGTQEAQVTQGG